MKSLIVIVNVALTSLMIYRVVEINNDKGHLIIVFYFPVLIILNLVVALVYFFTDRNVAKFVLRVALIMAVLYVPILVLAIAYI